MICGGEEGFRREGIETFRGAGEPPCKEGYEYAVTMDGRLPGWDDALFRPRPRLLTVLAGIADATLPIFGAEAADRVESVGDGASPPEPGGPDALPRRWEMVPKAGDVFMSAGLLVGVTSERTDIVDPPRGLGVVK